MTHKFQIAVSTVDNRIAKYDVFTCCLFLSLLPSTSFSDSFCLVWCHICLKNFLYVSGHASMLVISLSGFICLKKSLFWLFGKLFLRGIEFLVDWFFFSTSKIVTWMFSSCHSFRKKSAVLLLCSFICYLGFVLFCFWLPSGLSPSLGFFFSLGYIPRSGVARSYGNCMLNILRKCQAVFPEPNHFIILSIMYEISDFSTFLSALVIVHLFDFRSLSGCEVVSHCAFE